MPNSKSMPPIDEPCDATASDGVVAVSGPAGCDVELTPRAALETARNLSDAAIDALIDRPSAATPAKRKA